MPNNNNNNLPPTPPLTPPSIPPQPLLNFPNRGIPSTAEIVFTSPTLKRKNPFNQKLANALAKANKNEATRNGAITPKRGKKISFAPGTKNVSTNNANTPPLDGGRRRTRRTHNKRKNRRTCRR
jgi:hypothetical protein